MITIHCQGCSLFFFFLVSRVKRRESRYKEVQKEEVQKEEVQKEERRKKKEDKT